MPRLEERTVHHLQLVNVHDLNIIETCPGCNLLFGLWVFVAVLSLAVGFWRCYQTDKGTGFTDAAYIVAVGGLIIRPIQSRHYQKCRTKRD